MFVLSIFGSVNNSYAYLSALKLCISDTCSCDTVPANCQATVPDGCAYVDYYDKGLPEMPCTAWKCNYQCANWESGAGGNSIRGDLSATQEFTGLDAEQIQSTVDNFVQSATTALNSQNPCPSGSRVVGRIGGYVSTEYYDSNINKWKVSVTAYQRCQCQRDGTTYNNYSTITTGLGNQGSGEDLKISGMSALTASTKAIQGQFSSFARGSYDASASFDSAVSAMRFTTYTGLSGHNDPDLRSGLNAFAGGSGGVSSILNDMWSSVRSGITSNLPFTQSSWLQVSSGSSSLGSFSIYNRTISFDFSRWESILIMFGNIILSIAYIVAAIILIRS